MEATDGLRQAFEDLRETAERLAEAPATRAQRALDWAPKAVRLADSSHGHPVEEKQTAFNHVPDISTHVVINNEMKKQLIGDKLPDGRIEQIKFLLKRLTWREMEDIAHDIQECTHGETSMASALIEWAHKT